MVILQQKYLEENRKAPKMIQMANTAQSFPVPLIWDLPASVFKATAGSVQFRSARRVTLPTEKVPH